MDCDGWRRVSRVPHLAEGRHTLVEALTCQCGDGPVDDVREARSLALQDGREVAERLQGLLSDRGTDDLTVGVDAVLPPM